MLAFVVGNTNFNFNRSGMKNMRENTKLKNLQVESKELMEKVKNFNPDSCYDFSDLGEEYDESLTANVTIKSIYNNLNSNNGIDNSTSKIEKQMEFHNLRESQVIENQGITGKKILKLKKVIKMLDIVASIMIISGCLISQIEKENYYNDNIFDRVHVVNLISDLKGVNGNVSKLDLSKYNISYFNNDTFIKGLNFSDFVNLPIPMPISENCLQLRYLICILTILSVPLIVVGRYVEFIRDYVYVQKYEGKFYNSPMINTLIYELLLIGFFQYPNVDSYTLLYELGAYLCLPYSLLLSSLTFVRFYFVLKLFKHLTKWTSTSAEYVCELSSCNADTGFAFKAFQKENPFFILLVIFIFTCVIFGMSLRTFEQLFWETRTSAVPFMDWDYKLNGLWCIFVSMCGVGYGDYSAMTQIGRVITIMACLIGTYFVSMMMVFMTQKSGLSENEKKAYNLVSRLKMRKDIEQHNSFIVLNGLKMAMYKVQKNDNKIEEKTFQIKYSYEKRNVITHIELIKSKLKLIQTFASVSLKEKLFNISERIDKDIKEVKEELESLKFINEIIVSYSDCQIDIAKYLKKNCYANKLMYTIIQKKPIFGKLNNVDQSLKNEFEAELDAYEGNSNMSRDYTSDEEEYEDNIFNYDVGSEQLKEYFDFLFNSNRGRKTVLTKASKTVDFIKRKRTANTHKLKKVQDLLKRKMNNKNIMKEKKTKQN